MSDDQSDSDALFRAALARRAMLRIARLIVNALSIGLVATMLLAIGVLWLEKRSGIALDREQYRGLLLIIFLVFTLSAYVVLEFFQHHDDKEDARGGPAVEYRQIGTLVDINPALSGSS